MSSLDARPTAYPARRGPFHRLVWLVALGFATAPSAAAQEVDGCTGVGQPWALEGPRLALPGTQSGALRFGSRAVGWGCVGHTDSVPSPVAGLHPTVARLRVGHRGGYPFDRNDGALWSGVGFSAAASGGAEWTGGPVRIVLHPMVGFQANGDFQVATTATQLHPLAHPFLRLDWPQRLREDAFWTVDPGQSAAALRWGPAEAAAATENLWWGPARRYPLLLSNTAPGFPHVRFGLIDPVPVGIGTLRANLLWGRLDESEGYDSIPGNDHRLLTGFFVELAPRGLDGLTLGVGALQHNDWTLRSDNWLNMFRPFNEGKVAAGDGLLSVTASWTLEERSFEAYFEWAREDQWADLEDLLTEPDHSQAYVLGFERIVGGERPSLRVAGELAHLKASRTGRPGVVYFYRHGRVKQGHTHRGQLLGAAVGPGSDAGYLAVDVLRPRRSVGAYFERIRRDDDTYLQRFAGNYGFGGHDLEWTLGVQGSEQRGALSVQWEAAGGRRKNRSFIGHERLDGENPDYLRESSVALTVTGSWLPPR